MLHEFGLGDEFLAQVFRWDEEIARAVAEGGCKRCDGPLHQANYHRKPRGGWIFKVLMFTIRRSLCCGHCRKRSLPPSLLFLGRRVYIESVVLIASFAWEVAPSVRDLADSTGVPEVTLRRWRMWWHETFPSLRAWSALRARFAAPPPEEATLPASLLFRIMQDISNTALEATPAAVMLLTARCLAPVTTALKDAASFVRAVAARRSSIELTQKMSIAVGPRLP